MRRPTASFLLALCSVVAGCAAHPASGHAQEELLEGPAIHGLLEARLTARFSHDKGPGLRARWNEALLGIMAPANPTPMYRYTVRLKNIETGVQREIFSWTAPEGIDSELAWSPDGFALTFGVEEDVYFADAKKNFRVRRLRAAEE